MSWFHKKQKSNKPTVDSSNIFASNKIYNLDQQFITNILVMHLAKKTTASTDDKKSIEELSDTTIKFLSKFLNKTLTNEIENTKIKIWIENYMNTLIVQKTKQNIGLLKIDLADFEKASPESFNHQTSYQFDKKSNNLAANINKIDQQHDQTVVGEQK